MKKLFLLFATVTLLVGVQACKQKEEAAATTEVAPVVEAAPVVVVDSPAVASTPEVKKGGVAAVDPNKKP